mgnify:FL=1
MPIPTVGQWSIEAKVVPEYVKKQIMQNLVNDPVCIQFMNGFNKGYNTGYTRACKYFRESRIPRKSNL